MKADQPATIPVALAGVLSTGVAFFALFAPFLQDPTAQAATIAFGNSLIVAGTAIFLNRSTTSNTAPVVEKGTEVGIVGSSDTVVVQPTPPGPEAIEGGAPPTP